ncbi:hypothetical protein [Actinocorallia populi]|uniref:hypothetical protein n=1 Tax=Actinocorallia populi TaxID=2079200 RepID=UPI000D095185|nr:hypothetical protein [Actinocorallia populi]
MTDSTAHRRHRELVRLSYLILPGGGSQEARLVLARRIVERNLPRRPQGPQAHSEARVRVFRQSMRPPRRLRLRAAARLRRGAPPGNAALAALTPEERVAYVLSRVAGMRRHVVRELLADLGVPGSRELLERIDAMEDLRVVAPAAAVRVGRRRRSGLPVLAACAATCVLVGVAVVQESDVPVAAVRSPEPSAAAPAATPAPAPRPDEVRYWRGRMPGGAGTGELLCRHDPLPGGGFDRQGLLVWRGESLPARDCADGRTGLWWRSPAGRWFYLAAAEPGTELSVTDGRRRDGLWTVRGPRGERAPEREIPLLKG